MQPGAVSDIIVVIFTHLRVTIHKKGEEPQYCSLPLYLETSLRTALLPLWLLLFLLSHFFLGGLAFLLAPFFCLLPAASLEPFPLPEYS